MVDMVHHRPRSGGGVTYFIESGRNMHVVDVGSLIVEPNDQTRDGFPMQVYNTPAGFTVAVDTTVRRSPVTTASDCGCGDPGCYCGCVPGEYPCEHGSAGEGC